MTYLHHFFTGLALAGILIAGACSKVQQEQEEPANPGEIQTIKATVVLPEETKLLYEENDPDGKASGMKAKWEAGDSFRAITASGQAVMFELQSGAGSATGVFTATAAGIDESTPWTAVLGAHTQSVSKAIGCPYDGQAATLALMHKNEQGEQEAENDEKNLQHKLDGSHSGHG